MVRFLSLWKSSGLGGDTLRKIELFVFEKFPYASLHSRWA